MSSNSSKKWGAPAKAVLVVAIMLACAVSPVLTMTDRGDSVYAETGEGSGVVEPTKRYYVSLGDSVANGYGFFEYFDNPFDKDYVNDILGKGTGDYPMGLEVAVPGAYPSLVLDELNKDSYRDAEWELIQLAISGMRMDELRYLLDDEFYAEYPTGVDGYMPNAQLRDAVSCWAEANCGHTTHNYVQNPIGASFCQTCMDEFREYYKAKITEASLITINLGSNNFGTFVTWPIAEYIGGNMGFDYKETFSTYIDDNGFIDELFETVFDAIIYEMFAGAEDENSITSAILKAREAVAMYEADPDAAKAVLEEYLNAAIAAYDGDVIAAVLGVLEQASSDLSDWAKEYKDKAEALSIIIDNTPELKSQIAFFELLENVISSLIYSLVAYNACYDASMEWLLGACGSDTEIIVIGVDNIAEKMMLSVDVEGTPMEIPLGQLYGYIVEMANTHLKYLSPYTYDPRVSFIDSPDVHTYFDQAGSEDSSLSMEMWYHILDDFGMYYHNDDCDASCTAHLQTLYFALNGLDNNIKMMLAGLEIFEVVDDEYVLNPAAILTPAGLDLLSSAFRELLGNMVVFNEELSAIPGLSDCIEAVSGGYMVKKDSLANFIAITGAIEATKELAEFAGYAQQIDGVSATLKNVEEALKTAYNYNTLPIEAFTDPEIMGSIGSMGQVIVGGGEISDAQYALINFYLTFLMGNGVGCHPDAEGHDDFTDAIIAELDARAIEKEMKEQIAAEIEALLKEIHEYLLTENAKLEVALERLDAAIAEFIQKYGEEMTIDNMIAALEMRFNELVEDIIEMDIVGTIKEYIAECKAKGEAAINAAIAKALEILEAEVEHAKAVFGEYYAKVIAAAEECAQAIIDAWIAAGGGCEPNPPYVPPTDGACGTIVSIGDSVAYGYGLDDLNDRYSILVAEALGLDPKNKAHFVDLSMPGLRVMDILSTLTGEGPVDEYGENFSEYIETQGEAYLESIMDAEVIIFNAGANDFKFALDQIAGQFMNGEAPFEMDFSIFDLLDDSAKEAIAEIQIFMDEYTAGIEDPEQRSMVNLASVATQSILYGYLGFMDNYLETISMIKALNPDAKMVTLGLYNQFSDVVYDDGERFIPVGELYGHFVGAVNIQIAMFSAMAGVDYVDVYDASTPLTTAIAAGSPVGNLYNTVEGIPLVIAAVVANGANTHPDIPGHAFMADQIMDVMGDLQLSGHHYVEVVDDKYLVSGATIDKAAVYYKSCSECGHAGKETFTYGEPLVPGGEKNHQWQSNDGKVVITGSTNINGGVVNSDFNVNITVTEGEKNLDAYFDQVFTAFDENYADYMTGTVDLDITISLGTEDVEFEISADRLSKAAAKGAYLWFNGTDYQIGFGSDVAGKLAQKGGKVAMSMDKADKNALEQKQKDKIKDRPAIVLNATANGEGVHDLGGVATISFDFTKGTDAPVVYHIDKDGKIDKRTTSYDDNKGRVTFKSNTYSVYFVGTAADAESGEKGGDNTMLIVGAVIAVIAVIAVAAFIYTKKH